MTQRIYRKIITLILEAAGLARSIGIANLLQPGLVKEMIIADIPRLIGDRIFADPEPLAPTTTTSTYRQQLQRAFAVELLCPFAALEDMLEGDTSDDACADAAAAFDVSPLAVRWQLENNQPKADYTANHERQLLREQRDDLMRDVRG